MGAGNGAKVIDWLEASFERARKSSGGGEESLRRRDAPRADGEQPWLSSNNQVIYKGPTNG